MLFLICSEELSVARTVGLAPGAGYSVNLRADDRNSYSLHRLIQVNNIYVKPAFLLKRRPFFYLR